MPNSRHRRLHGPRGLYESPGQDSSPEAEEGYSLDALMRFYSEYK